MSKISSPAAALLLLAFLGSCSSTPEGRFEGTGRHARSVTTPSRAAQEFFNQGLDFLFACNAGRGAEAEEVYRDDLRRRPENGCSLLGLGRSLRAPGKDAADADRRFREAWKDADISATSSCLCLPAR